MISDPIRFSNLKHIARSPAHYHHAVTVGRDDKPWLRGGRGLHAVLFDTPYVVFDGASRRGKAWDAFVEVELSDAKFQTNPGDAPEVILANELPVYMAMTDAIRSELARQDLDHLLHGETEKRIEWEWLGRKCAGTPDVASAAHIVDVKTTCNADPRRFHWDARKFCYAEQLVWYDSGVCLAESSAESTSSRCSQRMVYRESTGDDVTMRDLYIIAVEKTAPHPVVIWRVTDKMRIQAEKTTRLWIEQLLACEAANQWPGYAQTVQPLDVLESDGVTLQIGGEDVDVE